MTSFSQLIFLFIISHSVDIDNSSNKENIPPAQDDDELFDFENSSFKYDDEYSSEEEYVYSSDSDKSGSETSAAGVYKIKLPMPPLSTNENNQDGSSPGELLSLHHIQTQ